MPELNVYTAREVAALLKLSVSQVYALVHAGRLRCLRLTTKRQGGLRFTGEQITDFLQASGSARPGPSAVLTAAGRPVVEPDEARDAGFCKSSCHLLGRPRPATRSIPAT
jgi:excisionase family DNA binding protein